MITTIRRILGGTADAHIIETHEIMIRCARRCAYDLDHAVDMIRLDEGDWRVEIRDMLRQKARYWIGLFASGNSVKDYRLRLHADLDDRDREIERLRGLCEANGIDHQDPRGTPF